MLDRCELLLLDTCESLLPLRVSAMLRLSLDSDPKRVLVPVRSFVATDFVDACVSVRASGEADRSLGVVGLGD